MNTQPVARGAFRLLAMALMGFSMTANAGVIIQMPGKVGVGHNVSVVTSAQAAAAQRAADEAAAAKLAAERAALRQAAEAAAAAQAHAAAEAIAVKQAMEAQAAAQAAAKAAEEQRQSAEAEAARQAAEAEAAAKASAAAQATAAREAAQAQAAVASLALAKAQDERAAAAAAKLDLEAQASERAAEARASVEMRLSQQQNGSDGSISLPASGIAFTADTVGTIFAVDFVGYVDEALAPGLGGFGLFEFLGSADGKTWDFKIITLENISKLPILASRISEFGFNANPLAVAASADGLFDVAELNGNVPMLGTRNVCFRTDFPGSCAGGGGGGLALGQSLANDTFSVTIAETSPEFALSSFYVRFQSIEGANGTSGVGAGIVTPVPEPMTWVMLIGGFFFVGSAMRSARRLQQPALAA